MDSESLDWNRSHFKLAGNLDAELLSIRPLWSSESHSFVTYGTDSPRPSFKGTNAKIREVKGHHTKEIKLKLLRP